MRKTLSTLVLLSLTVAVLAAQGPWRTPPGTSGKMRIASTAADALCVGSTAVSPTSSACTGGIYTGALHAAGLIDATTAGALGNKYVVSISTGTQADFNPGISGNTVIRLENGAALNITGFAAGTQGQTIDIYHTSANLVLLYPDNTGSIVGNRLTNFVQGAPTPLAQNGHARFIYDFQLAHWTMVEYEQGSWLPVAFVSTDYTGDAAGDADWTVVNDSTRQIWYRLDERTMTVTFSITGSTVANTPSALQFPVPGGMGAQRDTYNMVRIGQSSGFVGMVEVLAAAPTLIQILKVDYPIPATFTNSTAATLVQGSLSLEVN